MAPNQGIVGQHDPLEMFGTGSDKIRVAILGCGMMGQEHISYIAGYKDLRVSFLCDPHPPSLEKAVKVLHDFHPKENLTLPVLLADEQDLLDYYSDQIDLLVIATPNHLHTPSLLKWGEKDITILCEKPVAVNQDQIDILCRHAPDFKATIWVAMEYRYIPAIAKLLEMRDKVGPIKMISIKENRYPFLHKVGAWNREAPKTGDSLVEKCCHFFDLFRLISGKEASLQRVRALAQRGINYETEPVSSHDPIIDSAYVTLPFRGGSQNKRSPTIGCLELCMFAEGSRHQEEIIVTGTKGRLEAYLPENKVYFFGRPNHKEWQDRSVPPPATSICSQVIDCSDVKSVFGLDNAAEMPTHGGYHYSSTAVEWYNLIEAMKNHRERGEAWSPDVSLSDGIRAVEIGLKATKEIVNDLDQDED